MSTSELEELKESDLEMIRAISEITSTDPKLSSMIPEIILEPETTPEMTSASETTSETGSPKFDSEMREQSKNQLKEIVKPFQQEQKRQQKKSDFIEKCIHFIEKNDFFQLDDLLKGKQVDEILEDSHFHGCKPIFSSLRASTDKQIDQYRLEFKQGLLAAAEKVGLPMKVDIPRFFVLKGIEGEMHFTNRTTTINQTTLKSVDPKKIVSKALDLKKKLYDSVFEPQKFINGLLECYQQILKKEKLGAGDTVPILQLYTDYVLSMQSKTFFHNMDKAKFRGYSIEQFAVHLWRFFTSGVQAEGGYRIRLNPGRGNTFFLIDQDGEKRHITHASFVKHK